MRSPVVGPELALTRPLSPRSSPFLFTPCILAGLLAAGGCDRQSGDAAQPAEGGAVATAEPAAATASDAPLNGTLDIAHRGSRMPEFTLADPAGRKLRLSETRGTPVLINLWATWCGPCVTEMPMLDALAREQDGRLRVLTISQDLQGAEKVTPFFAARKFARLEPWLDPEAELGLHYGTGILPTTILYDARGREVWRMIGGHDWTGPRTAAMLAGTLAGKPAG
jgi:thiol-disulfide isomerase/thioredoxin